MERRDKYNYYLDIAETVLERGTCLRRNYGAVIVKNDSIISTGYTGSPRGRKNCLDVGTCKRQSLKLPQGERYELCRSVHAEANAIIAAARTDMIGSTLFLCGRNVEDGKLVANADSCSMCKRLIINAGIERIVARNTNDEYTITNVDEWIKNDDSL